MNPIEIRDAVLMLADPTERRRYLDRVCAGAIDLRCEVEQMLGIGDPAESEQLATDAFATKPPKVGPVVGGSEEPSLCSGPFRCGGRYRAVRRIGEGAFGDVWQGHDDQLLRPVAIKISKPGRFAGIDAAEAFLQEARTVATLPPGRGRIVDVYEHGHLDDGRVYIVLQFINGPTLRERLVRARPTFKETASITASVAYALARIHKKELIHRDVKPENILIDEAEGSPYLADFGISTSRARSLEGKETAGTVPYMSPEQVEGGIVDHRSDLFSLGVVLYEMLTGERPFDGASSGEVWGKIVGAAPSAPSEVVPGLPSELERICLRALEKKKLDRYPSALDMAEDLEQWFTRTPAQSSTETESDVPVIPKGLRSFDSEDAGFFLQLLPGPRRDGLPESVQFWKKLLEERDKDKTFAVGLLQGPSGSGKSSLLKAGIVPRLEGPARTIIVDASVDDTESRLVEAVRRVAAEVPVDAGLVTTLHRLRERSDGKIVIIIDQFEQWLQSHPDPDATELVAALRQCDGGRLQTLVLVREDYNSYRFMSAVGVPILEGRNWGRIDCLPVDHARSVLVRFGQGLGRLPRSMTGITPGESAFLDHAIAGLAGDQRRVVPVQLALFADLVRSLPWTLETLGTLGDSVGGSRRLLDRVGVAFLEGAFCSRAANPAHRAHAEAAKRVLESLLPDDSGIRIKRHERSIDDLLAASGYAGRPADFRSLFRILDGELRLVTPAHVLADDGRRGGEGPEPAAHYQLTHDYLVSAIRDWLATDRRRTAKGRAELVLAERTAFWNERPEVKQLPFVTEWLRIRALTRSRDWRPKERRMMARADRYHGVMAVIASTLVILAAAVAVGVRARSRVETVVHEILEADPARVVARAEEGAADRWIAGRAAARLRAEFTAPENERPGNAARKLRTAIGAALLSKGEAHGDDPVQTYLLGRLVGAAPNEVRLILQALEPREAWIERILPEIEQRIQGLPAAAAVASFRPERFDRIAVRVADDLVHVPHADLTEWLECFRGVSRMITAAVVDQGAGAERTEPERLQAARILADYDIEDMAALRDVAIAAGPKECDLLSGIMEGHRDQLGSLLEEVLEERCDPGLPSSDPEREDLGLRVARAGALLLRLGRPDRVWPLFVHSEDPRVRSNLVDLVRRYRCPPELIAERLAIETDGSARRALLLALGEIDFTAVDPRFETDLVARAEEMFQRDPDPGMHSAARWFLCCRGKQPWVEACEQEWCASGAAPLALLRGENPRRWFVDGIGMTYTVIEGPTEFWMGSPPEEVDRETDEPQKRALIPASFAISTTAVTNRQLAQWPRLEEGLEASLHPDVTRGAIVVDDKPAAVGLTWHAIARFCNWMSEREAIPRDQWCYEEDDGYAMKIKNGWRSLVGYRLGTGAELEYAIRAGAATSRFYGESAALLDRYAWYFVNAGGKTHPVGELKPNDYGLFDALGNCFVLAHEPFPDTENWYVRRGGGWNTHAGSVRSANWAAREIVIGDDGWRLVRRIPGPTVAPRSTTTPDVLSAIEPQGTSLPHARRSIDSAPGAAGARALSPP